MSAERLLAYYDRFADSPDAIPRLRRLVLDLAVRGKLVPQDRKDELASELLKRIEAQKARLVKAGKNKKQEPPPPIAIDDVPFDLPVGWSPTRLAVIAICLDYMREPVNATERERRIAGKQESELFPYFGATQQQGLIDSYIFDEELVLLGEDGVPFFDPLRPKAYLISGKSWVNNHAHVFRGIFVSPNFLAHCLNTFDYSGRVVGATRAKLNQAKALDIPIALPPLAEQHRIVAKVDELMALCDQLEEVRADRETTRDRLTAASFARLDSPDPVTFSEGARFALENVAPLTVRPDQIRQIRQTVLNLAVRGKLVPQDPNDEPVSELLKRVSATKGRLAKAGEIRKEKPLPELQDADLPFHIPCSWVWVRLETLAQKITDGEHLSPNKTTSGMPLLTAMHVSASGLTLDNPQFVSLEDGLKSRLRCDPRRGDILICSRGTIGRCAVVDTDEIFCLMGSVILVRLPSECSESYFNAFLSTGRAQRQMRGMSGATAVQALYLKDIRLCPLPLPPLAEQQRIVAKVSELMALLDKLEAQLTASRSTATALMDAVMARIVAANRVDKDKAFSQVSAN